MSEQTTETKKIKVLLAKGVVDLDITVTSTHLSESERRAIVDPGRGVDHLLNLAGRFPHPCPVHWGKALAYLVERFAVIPDVSLERLDPLQSEILTSALAELGKIPRRLALVSQNAARDQRRRPGRR